MQKKGKYSLLLNELQKQLSDLFKKNGYKKYNRTYNKPQSDGLIHVINFQLGEYPLGDKYIVPGLRENLYGKFAINLGVYIPYIDHLERHYDIKSFVQDSCCEIRKRLTENPDDSDLWIDLPDNISEIQMFIQNLIETKGFPFLNQFKSLNDIINYYNEYSILPFNTSGRSKFSMALIYYGLGNKEKYEQYISEIVSESSHKGFIEHLKKIYEEIKRNE